MLESDKATMEVPSPAAGKVGELKVAVGDKVAEGTVILTLETADAPRAPAAEESPAHGGYGDSPGPADGARAGRDGARPRPASPTTPTSRSRSRCSAPARAATRPRSAPPISGSRVALIDRGETLGGVCLNVGCIPSKALLHVAKVLTEAEELGDSGISFGKPTIDVDHIRAWKNDVVGRLTGGLDGLAKQRKVQVVRGVGEFTGPNSIKVGDTVVGFEHCIIASGSEAASLPFLPEDPRIMDSTGALEVEEIPERLLVIGGGIIGLEMATVYDALGSKVTVVELLDQLIPGADKDLDPRAREAHQGPLRGDPPHDRRRVGRGGAGRPEGQVRRAHARRSTASWSPSAGARTARSSAPRRRA